MDAVELIARAVLAATFALAGFAKLTDPGGSRRTLTGLGIPGPLARPASVALPLAELAVAAMLVPDPTAFAGALGALVLLLGFCAAIVSSIARGEAPECHCFGQLHAAPVGWGTLLRNLALAGLAAIALAGAV